MLTSLEMKFCFFINVDSFGKALQRSSGNSVVSQCRVHSGTKGRVIQHGLTCLDLAMTYGRVQMLYMHLSAGVDRNWLLH
jgi:hypothetical protein